MASPEEGLMPFRSDPGLDGASCAAMMRPSCCKDSRTGIAAAVPVRQQLQGVLINDN